jgi:hypothetical protein
MWLLMQPNSASLVRTVAVFGSADVRAVLASYLGGYVEAQDAAARRYRQEQQEQEDRQRAELEERKSIVRASADIYQVLGRLSQLEAKEWPDLEPERISWMRDHVERLFRESGAGPYDRLAQRTSTHLSKRAAFTRRSHGQVFLAA